MHIYIYQVVVSQQSASSPLFKSLAFLAISDRYATLFFFEIFDKMAAFGHFGCPKFTLDHISGHFRSIGHFGFQKLTNKIFLWTNDIVKTEYKQLQRDIHITSR